MTTKSSMQPCPRPLVLHQESQVECISGITFGCYGDPVDYMPAKPSSITADSMWVAGGCHGRFHCGTLREIVQCGAGSTTQLGRVNCSCSRERTANSAPTTMEQLPEYYLAPYWKNRGVYKADIDRAERWLRQQSRYIAPGAFRAKLINGSLWVKMIQVLC